MIEEEVQRLLSEGGNVFSDKNSLVPKDSVDPLIKWTLKKAKLTGLKYTIIGNIHKPVSGDIDILFDAKSLFQKLQAQDLQDFWVKIEAHLKKQKLVYSLNKGFREIHILAPLIDSRGKQLPAVIDRQGTIDPSGKPGYVQIDIMLGNDDFSPDYYYTAKDTKYKSVHRNMLLASIFSVLQFKAKNDTKHKFQMTAQGLELVNFIMKGKKKQKLSTKMISTDMNKVARILFGKSAKASDIDSIERMWKLFVSSKFKWPEIRRAATKDYISVLTRTGLEIPPFVK